jgi:pimeloyl-ACP methyl ester carboxylesterase
LEYLEQGDPAGIPVILLHGYTDSRRSWERILPMLPNSLRVFALTQRGHGESDKPASGYAPADFAGDVIQFMDLVGLKRAVLVGHSMGSVVARRIALDQPERIRGLVLEAAFATLKGSPIMEGFWSQTIAPLEAPVPRQFVVEFQQSTLARPVPDWFFELVVGESRKAPIQVWKGVIDQMRQTDFLAETTQIKAPTLILWGDQDSFAPLAEQQLLQSTIPGSRLVIYTGTGHGMHWEEPERFVSDLVQFVAEVDRGPER